MPVTQPAASRIPILEVPVSVAILLINPKYPHNVAATLRAGAILGASELFWTGSRVAHPDNWPEGTRMPREERQGYEKYCKLTWLGDHPTRPVDLATVELFHDRPAQRYIPVCVEKLPGAEDARVFSHPRHALYVFGPEDGDVPKGVRHACHAFVEIPSAIDMRSPLNLSHAVAVMLYARMAASLHGLTPVPAYSAHGDTWLDGV
jgi:tRNA(Leu) C34 or U34 (ribose-2'-O)-methylase TrmL